ncbi:sugar kinase [Arthrobacter antibioticus]|uniref:sugar kinase n=1 Tax=Arthrobacter sp. H35-MC1 TaxID=3046203 RepID=UPI0024B8B68D|nr:sugar kinase [Arthrobacter sp. H35-MC1]MDJ0316795.1 sugar kinase [Arthrobacter sp. H35-MC1]
MLPVELLTFGETMVSLRSRGPLAQGGTLTMHAAGSESNVAIALARLGHCVRWTGCVGMDPQGDFIERQLRSESVELSLRRDGDRSTGVMFLEQRTADIGRAFYYRSDSAGSMIGWADLEPALEAGTKVLHLSGITPALSSSAFQAVQLAAQRAYESGVVVSLDVNFRNKLWTREHARKVLTSLIQHIHIVIASDDELDLLSEMSSELHPSDSLVPRIANELLEGGVQEVVVKLGADGADVYSAAGFHHQNALKVQASDTVGAGDAFAAGYLSALLDGEPVENRLRRGTIMGAFAVSTEGDWEGLPRRSELELFNDQLLGGTER